MDSIKSNKYSTLFFDLDHTLWDYNTSSKQTLSDIYDQYLIGQDLFTLDIFLKTFNKVNDSLWHKYNKGLIDKAQIRESRFDQILSSLMINNKSLAGRISTEYLFECPRKPNLMPHTKQVLEILSDKYHLSILTNGFEDVQRIKLKCSEIDSFFEHVITSDGCGYQKPDPTFYQHALEKCKSLAQKSLMIGDNLKTDIAGALNIGIDTVYFNPSQNGRPHKSTFEISSLDQLLQIV